MILDEIIVLYDRFYLQLFLTQTGPGEYFAIFESTQNKTFENCSEFRSVL